MTQQWHNTKIQKKPCNRYNPSIRQEMGAVYRPWYILVTILSFFIGLALIGCAVSAKSLSSNISDEIFHLWIGIPLVALGVFSLICFVVKKKKLVIVFLICAIIVMVICAIGALVGGVRYWMDGWQRAKLSLDDDKCSVGSDNVCKCPNNVVMPVNVDDCGDLETIVRLIIAEIALSAGGFIASTIAVYLSFMAICCGPWMYMEWYDEENDPDYSAKDSVRHVSGNVNPSYGGNGGNQYSSSNY